MFYVFKYLLIFLYNILNFKSENSFYSAQVQIKQILESDHYPSFLITDAYKKLSEEFELESNIS
jgi:hypothetical protein